MRAKFSNYLVLPTKFNFRFSFRVFMLVIKFIVKCRKLKPFEGPKLSSPVKKVPAILSVLINQQKNTILVNDSLLNLDMMKLEDLSFSLAATYLFRTTTEEVKQFNKKEKIEKISVESNGILYSKNRILEAMEFKMVTGMEMINLDPLKVNTKCPVMDRYSQHPTPLLSTFITRYQVTQDLKPATGWLWRESISFKELHCSERFQLIV